MMHLSVEPVGSSVELQILSEDGVASVRLDPRGGFALIALIARAINSLPTPKFGGLELAVLRSKEPAVEVTASSAGGAVVAIRPDPFQSLELEFGAASLANLIIDLQFAAKIVNMPSH